MTELDQFLTSISSEVQPNPSLSDCLQALWWAQKGNWDKAHDKMKVLRPEIGFMHTSIVWKEI